MPKNIPPPSPDDYDIYNIYNIENPSIPDEGKEFRDAKKLARVKFPLELAQQAEKIGKKR